MSKVALIWPTFSFYHIARFRAVYAKLGDRALGIELAGGGNVEDEVWRFTKRNGLPIITLFPDRGIRSIPQKTLENTLIDTLKKHGVDTVFVNGYSSRESLAVINWAKRNAARCYTFSETKKDDFKRSFLKELVKKWIIKKLAGAICGGRLHKDYFVELGMPEDNIALGYDVVDNEFFKRAAELAVKNKDENRARYKLPEKYFITCSRFVKKKNLDRLLSAYNMYRGLIPGRNPWGLVLVGQGPEEGRLKEKIAQENIDGVLFAGSQDPEGLAIYYGLASCFILASTTEQWGLVVNEAMACGLPVLVSKIAGAADELVENGVNGYTFDPCDVKQIAGLMEKIDLMEPNTLKKMGTAAQEKIRPYSPDHFAENLIKLISNQKT